MSRPGLHEWLRSLLEKDSVPGVQWFDRGQEMFKIPWRNQKSRDLSEEDRAIFIEYAKFTDKYVSQGKPDLPKWKQNLKSAMNKNKYLRRRKEHDRQGVVKPFRVYQFVLPNEQGELWNMRENRPENIALHENSSLETNAETGRGYASSSSLSSFCCESSTWSPSSDVRNEVLDQQRAVSPRTIPALHTLLSDNTSVDTGGFHASMHLQSSRQSSATVEPSDSDQFCDTQFDAFLSPASFPDVLSGFENSQTAEQAGSSTASPPEHCQSVFGTQVSKDTFVLANVPTETESTSSPDTMSSRQVIDQSLALTGEQQSTCAPNTTSLQFGMENDITYLAKSLSNLKAPGDPYQVIQEPQNYLGNGANAAGVFTTAAPQVAINSDPVSVSQATVTVCETQGNQEPTPMSLEDEEATGPKVSTTNNGFAVPATTWTLGHTQNLLELQVIYGCPGHLVKQHKLQASTPTCRLYYHSNRLMDHVQDEMKGQGNIEQIALPSGDGYGYELKSDEKEKINTMLMAFQRGVFISYINGDIYAKRLCKLRIYFSDGVASSQVLERDNEQKIFDWQDFIASVETHKRNPASPIGKDHVYLTMGRDIEKNDDYPRKKLEFYVVIRHVEAAIRRQKFTTDHNASDGAQCSKSDSFDKALEEPELQKW